MKRTWSDIDIKFLIDNYSTMNNIDISKVVNHNRDSIRHKAKLLGLKKLGRRTNITYSGKLLDGSLTSLYWIGFILADGHIGKDHRLNISLSIKDQLHLQKLAHYLNVDVKALPHRFDTLSKDSMFVSLTASGQKDFKALCEIFDIKSNKTYNPPIFSKYTHLDESQWLALIIGFIDGDGCIQNQLRSKGNIALNIHLHIHKNWFDNIFHINNIIKKYCNIPTKMMPRKYDTMLRYDISNNQIICKLKKFIVENSLPYLERKWDKVDHTMTHTRNYHLVSP